MSMEINSNVTSQIMDLKTSAQGVTRRSDKATNNVEEYYEKLCKKFPQITFNTKGGVMPGNANKVVVNISPECLRKMANDPEFAKEVEWNLSGEVAAHSFLYSSARRDGVELGGPTVTYDANGNRESSCGGMRTANPSNGNNGIFGSQKSKKREQEEHLEEIREKRKKQEEYLEELREKRREREEYLSELSGSNGVAVKAYTQAEFDYASLLSTLDAKI